MDGQFLYEPVLYENGFQPIAENSWYTDVSANRVRGSEPVLRGYQKHVRNNDYLASGHFVCLYAEVPG